MATDLKNLNTNELLMQIYQTLSGENTDGSNVNQKLRFIFCKTSNVATATNLLGQYGISYIQTDSLQDGIEEFKFYCDDATYKLLFDNIIQNGKSLYISNSRLPIQGALGSITVSPTQPTAIVAKQYSVTGTPASLTGGTAVPVEDTVTIQNADASASLFLGDSSGQYIEILPGQSYADLRIADLQTIYAKSSTGTITVNVFGS